MKVGDLVRSVGLRLGVVVDVDSHLNRYAKVFIPARTHPDGLVLSCWRF